MRKELGVLLMENPNGDVSVQLLAEVKSSEAAFVQLAGHVGDPPLRATYISLLYTEDGYLRIASASAKILPVVDPAEDKPDGFVLGQGPVKFEPKG